ncbi:Lrp/AsnC family transcriptional regulator [Pseudomonas sp. B3G-3]|nr:Lrp/AsnC family transcriptional regulator [Pseudomonas sp. B3G-3]
MTEAMSGTDDFDLKMLSLLQGNGRLTNQELSELIGLSASQCSRRRISLEQAGLILGYHARLAPQAMNTEVVAMIEVRLVDHRHTTARAFETFVQEEPAVVDVYKTTGDADYSLKVAIAGLVELNALMTRLTAGETIGHLKTAVVLERLKEAGLPTLR